MTEKVNSHLDYNLYSSLYFVHFHQTFWLFEKAKIQKGPFVSKYPDVQEYIRNDQVRVDFSHVPEFLYT